MGVEVNVTHNGCSLVVVDVLDVVRVFVAGVVGEEVFFISINFQEIV